MEPLIELTNITYSYDGKKNILKNICCKFFPGECVAIIGPNGAGKTTFAYVLLKLLRIKENSIKHSKDLETAFVSQKTVIDWYIDAYDNIRLGARLKGLNISESKSITTELMERFKIDKLSYENVETLSGGQQKRIQIARTIAQDAEFTFLDEPTVGLDPQASTEITTYLNSLTQNHHKTIVMVTHDLDLLKYGFTRIIALSDGCIIFDDSIEAFEKLGFRDKTENAEQHLSLIRQSYNTLFPFYA